MPQATAQKQAIIQQHQRTTTDTGSVEVQVALFTHRIVYLTEHFKQHPKDVHSRRGLLVLVNSRRKLLKYLKRCDRARYYALLKTLSLRDAF